LVKRLSIASVWRAAKQFIGNNIELQSIYPFPFFAYADHCQSRFDCALEDFSAHAKIGRRFADAKNSWRNGVFHV
jgi:hypothetical protein